MENAIAAHDNYPLLYKPRAVRPKLTSIQPFGIQYCCKLIHASAYCKFFATTFMPRYSNKYMTLWSLQLYVSY